MLIEECSNNSGNVWTSVVLLKCHAAVLLQKWQDMLADNVVPVPDSVQVTVDNHQVGAACGSDATPHHHSPL